MRVHDLHQSMVTVAEWESACVICGAPFRIYLSLKCETPDRTNAFRTTTCRDHRLSASESARLCRSIRDGRQAQVLQEIREKKLAESPAKLSGAP